MAQKKSAKKQTAKGMGTVVRKSAPVNMGSIRTMANPAINGKGKIVVSHREYFGELLAGATSGEANIFTVDSYRINPSNPVLFPWLSAMAGLYESYRFKSLKFSYASEVNTSTGGYVAMACDFDAVDAPPSNKAAMMTFEGAKVCSPWLPFTLATTNKERDKIGPQRYCASVIPSGTDKKTYDVGNLLVARGGTSLAQFASMGQLYVEYEVELITPQSNPGLSFDPMARMKTAFASFQTFNTNTVYQDVLNWGAQALDLSNDQLSGLGSFLAVFGIFSLATAKAYIQSLYMRLRPQAGVEPTVTSQHGAPGRRHVTHKPVNAKDWDEVSSGVGLAPLGTPTVWHVKYRGMYLVNLRLFCKSEFHGNPFNGGDYWSPDTLGYQNDLNHWVVTGIKGRAPSLYTDSVGIVNGGEGNVSTINMYDRGITLTFYLDNSLVPQFQYHDFESRFLIWVPDDDSQFTVDYTNVFSTERPLPDAFGLIGATVRMLPVAFDAPENTPGASLI